MPQYVRLRAGSYEPVTQIGAPPVFQESPAQVSLPGSPGAGMVYLRHNFFPVSGSQPSRNPRVVDSPPATPEINTPLATIGTAITSCSAWLNRSIATQSGSALSEVAR